MNRHVCVAVALAAGVVAYATGPILDAQQGAPPANVPGELRGPKEGGRGDRPMPEMSPIVWAAGKPRVLIVSGGSSHDFIQFFEGTDRATLSAAGFSVNVTEDRDQAAAELGKADVLVVSVIRQNFDTTAYRQALLDFAAAGKGLVFVHSGVWYGYPQWPDLNQTLIGGGARSHDAIAPFSINVVKPDHPIMKGVPPSFQVEDELYHTNVDGAPNASPIEVLAETSPSVRYMKPHPSVWVTSHPKARIVGIAPGHDARVHDLPAFRTLLTNAVTWAAGNR
jgi:type 1 glutamine amidotransferase